MTSASERAWDLYTLKQSLEDQLQDVDGMLREALREAYEDDDVRALPNGYTIRRAETRDISVKAFSEKYPEIYERAITAKISGYKPELTKTDIKNALKAEDDDGKVLSKEAQEEILRSIESGIVIVKFSLNKPQDPHPGKVVE